MSPGFAFSLRVGASALLLLSCLQLGTAQDVGPTAVFIMDADGSKPKMLVRLPEFVHHGNPEMSNNGKFLTFTGSDQPKAAGKAYVCAIAANGDPNTLKKLAPGRIAQWSRDDKKLLFFCRPWDGEQPGVYVMNADGTDRNRLCDGTYPTWSPDGKKIAMASVHEGFWSIYTFEDGKRERLLHENYDLLIGAEWSPDGKQLAFIGARNNGWELGIISAKGSNDFFRVRFRTEDPTRTGWLPRWSPDGKQILFWVKDGADGHQLRTINPADDAAPVILKGQDNKGFNSDMAWTPDGRRILFSSDRNE